MTPSVLPGQLLITGPQNHIVEHYVDDNHSKGEDVRRCVLPRTSPRLWASPQLVPANAALEVLTGPEEYCIFQVRNLNILDAGLVVRVLLIIKKDIVGFDICQDVITVLVALSEHCETE